MSDLELKFADELPPLAAADLRAEDILVITRKDGTNRQVFGLKREDLGDSPVAHGHAMADVSGLGDALAGKAAATHGHAISEVEGLTEALAAAQGAADAAQNTADSAEMSAHTAQTNADDAYTLAHNHAQRTDNPHGVTAEQVGAAPVSHGHVISEVSGLTEALAGKAASSHGHTISEVEGLGEVLAGKAATNHGHEMADVSGLGDALAGKAAATHGHAISEVEGLTEALAAAQGAADAAQHTADSAEMSAHTAQTNADDAYTLAHNHAQRTDNPHGVTAEQVGAAPVSHGHVISEVSGLTEALAGKAASSHGHTISEVEGLGEVLAGKAATNHGHEMADVSGLGDALAGKAAATHGHTISEVSGLTEALAGKADSAHGHEVEDLASSGQPEGHIPEADGEGGVRWGAPPSGGGGDGAYDLYSTNRQVVFGFAGSGTSGAGSLIDGAPDHPSGFAAARIWQLGTGTAADGRVNLSVGANGANGVNRTKVRPGEFAMIEFLVRGYLPNFSDETNTFRAFFGVIRSTSGSTPDYAGAVLIGDQLTVGAQSAATESTGAAFTIAASVPFHLRVRIVPAGTVQLWVNGTSIGTVSTNVLTDGATLQQWMIGAAIAKSVGSTSRNLFVADAITLTSVA